MEKAILALGLLVLTGLLGGRVSNRFKLPAVTGYILFGLLIGPSVLGILAEETLEYLSPLHDLALGLIALTIGVELRWERLRKLGLSIINITVLQALAAMLLVIAAMLILGQPLPVALLLGAVCTATAPAATVAVIREYNAAGPLTKTLLAVVALDDALCVLIFGITLTMVKGIVSSSGESSWAILRISIFEILGSLSLGIILALFLSQLLKHWKVEVPNLLSLLLGTTMLAGGLATQFHLSPILTNMVLGTVLSNLTARRQLFRGLEIIERPIYIAFFALAGAGLELEALSHLGLVGVSYILARSLGKMFGSWLGGTLSHAPPSVNKYLGLALLPQAGVAIGLSMLVTKELPQLSGIISTVVLASVVVYELLGPVSAKYALVKAGEIRKEQVG